jgi:hypothetical protein
VKGFTELAARAWEESGDDKSRDFSEVPTIVAMHGPMVDVMQSSTINAGAVDGRCFKGVSGPCIIRI